MFDGLREQDDDIRERVESIDNMLRDGIQALDKRLSQW
jgi:hypothetical protein